MVAPLIRVAVRDKEGNPFLFNLQHKDIANHEQAIELTKGEFPDALVILASVVN